MTTGQSGTRATTDEGEPPSGRSDAGRPTHYLAVDGVGLLLLLPSLGVSFTGLLPSREVAIGIAIAVVVALGASGLILRGRGEAWSQTDPKRGARLKARGYYFGAAAYVATAFAALSNGLPQLIAPGS